MNRSRAWFEGAPKETGYRTDTLEKVTRLASRVGRHPALLWKAENAKRHHGE
jgi:hypothetical protein